MDSDLAAKITSRVDVSDSTGCWLWRNQLQGGQPNVSIAGKYRSALRISWLAFKGGEIPAGHQVKRTCGELRCVNPEHLIVRHPKRVGGLCKNGHDTEGKRGPCRECERLRQEKRRVDLLSRVTQVQGKEVSAYFSKNRSSHLAKYGLTENDVIAMLESQGYSCAICSDKLEYQHSDQSKRPNIDHCHETGRVRGILCAPCNKGIGQLRDSPSLCDRAAQYIRGASMPVQCKAMECTLDRG